MQRSLTVMLERVFSAFFPSAPHTCLWVRTSLYLFLLADYFTWHSQEAMPSCSGRETRAALHQPFPAGCYYRDAAPGSVLETSPMSGCSLKLEYLKGATAYPILRDKQWSIAHRRAGSLSTSSSSKEATGAQSSDQPRILGSSISYSACASPSSYSNSGRALQLPQVCQGTDKGQGRDVR